jgi:hypothetical protein|nr:MAG TPA: major tail protein [Caudoviricetes sp.]
MSSFIANRPIFPRNSFIVINGIKINDHNNGGLKFDVEAKSGEDGKVGTAVFKIYNLSQNTEVGSEIELWFGYAEDIGYYSKYEVIKKKRTKESATIIQELTCSERTKNSSKITSLSLDGNIRISQAIKEVVKELGLNLVSMKLKNDKVYTNGYTCYNQGFQELKELVADSESKMTLKGDDLYIYNDEKGSRMVIDLSFESGLMHNPEPVEKQEKEKKVNKKSDNKKKKNENNETEKKEDKSKDKKWTKTEKKKTIKESSKYDYTVECFPIHYIKKGDIVHISSDEINGFMQVEEVDLSLSDSWDMKLGVKELKDNGKTNGNNKDNTGKSASNKKR